MRDKIKNFIRNRFGNTTRETKSNFVSIATLTMLAIMFNHELPSITVKFEDCKTEYTFIADVIAKPKQ